MAAERSAGAVGELVLETLVVEGDENTVLVPGDRYAQMRNVYFILGGGPENVAGEVRVY